MTKDDQTLMTCGGIVMITQLEDKYLSPTSTLPLLDPREFVATHCKHWVIMVNIPHLKIAPLVGNLEVGNLEGIQTL